MKWKRARNYLSLISVLACAALFFSLTGIYWILLVLLFSAMVMGVSLYSDKVQKKELADYIETQGNTAELLLEETSKRYNNALLVQEIGQAISMMLDIDKLLEFVMQALSKRLDFDRGVVMLANSDRTRLVFTAGYGYNPDMEEIIRKTEFHLDNPGSKGVFVDSFNNRASHLVNDIDDISENLSRRSREFAELIGAHRFICVPIFLKNESLGVLVVDNIQSEKTLSKSDMNLLSGIAQQIGISIKNARSFRNTEEKYRELVENANSIIIRMDTDGRITFFNEFAQSFFGYTEEELLGKDSVGTIIPGSGLQMNNFKRMLREIDKHPERYANIQNENMLKDKGVAWIAWTNRPILDTEGHLKGILCIGNDITELKLAKKKIEQINELLLAIRSATQLITHEKKRERLIKGI